MKKSFEIFVPGRLCIIGEHSDWASSYKCCNDKIENGMAIVTSILEGIEAEISVSSKIILKEENHNTINCTFDELDLLMINDNFWKYALATIKYIKKQFSFVKGININIINATLPMKKGLGSSAAICLLIAKAYNLLYKLNLDLEQEKNIAYYGELLTGSKCGRLDQISELSIGVKKVEFNLNEVSTSPLILKKDVYMVYADINGKKDTMKILNDLNSCYPNYKNDMQKKVHDFLGKKNKKFVSDACYYLENGLIQEFGLLLTEYQKEFDESLIDSCSELKAPLLHKLLNDENIINLIYGGKGCGSGGDGTVQFVAKDELCQNQLIDYLKTLGINGKKLILKSNKIKKAIIPVGGYGTRMYPMTKIVGKEFLPIKDNDGIIKPAILILLQELVEAGIEKIGLILPEVYKKTYIDFFCNDYEVETTESLESKLKDIYEKIEFIEDNSHNGMGHSISLCQNFIGNDNFLLLLGDQIYNSKNDNSCIKQILDFYYKNELPTISVGETKLNDVVNYGILYGKKNLEDDFFEIETIVEKPSVSFALKNLGIDNCKGEQNFYSIFGCYLFDSSIFDILNDDFSKTLANYVTTRKCMAFIPDGKYYDIGNMKAYYDTFVNFSKDDFGEKTY